MLSNLASFSSPPVVIRTSQVMVHHKLQFVALVCLMGSALAYTNFQILKQSPKRFVAKTLKGVKCMSDCVVEGEGTSKFCWTHWTEKDTCQDTTTPAKQYFTSIKEGVKTDCVSECGDNSYSSFWCFTNVVTREWDHCSPRDNVDYRERECTSPCTKHDGTYYCETKKNVRTLCSPGPIIPKPVVVKNPNRCEAAVQPNQKNLPGSQPSTDIFSMVFSSEAQNSVHTLDEGNGPIINYSTSEHDGVTLVHSMRANLAKRNLNTTIPDNKKLPRGFATRLKQLSNKQMDAIGYLFPLSLGGPDELYNLVPLFIKEKEGPVADDAFYYWRDNEILLAQLMNDPSLKYVELSIIVSYEGDLKVPANRRPVAYGFRYIVNYLNSPAVDSGNCVFKNDSE